ncbi:MAG UNVERIFIED_CONTAM: hypothetical protein LVT10_18030 [Anaerolineae bacterium]
MLLTLVFSLVIGLGLVSAQDDHTLLLATTTSTQDSGLLDYILPNFEETYHATVKKLWQLARARRSRWVKAETQTYCWFTHATPNLSSLPVAMG